MREDEARRYRSIAVLMESFAKEGKAEQAATIQREVLACGESVETAHLVGPMQTFVSPAATGVSQ